MWVELREGKTLGKNRQKREVSAKKTRRTYRRQQHSQMRGLYSKYCRHHNAPCKWPLQLIIGAIPGSDGNAGDDIWFSRFVVSPSYVTQRKRGFGGGNTVTVEVPSQGLCPYEDFGMCFPGSETKNNNSALNGYQGVKRCFASLADAYPLQLSKMKS